MPSVGTVLDGKYRLVRQLGAGGMGIVYEADHIRLRQPFAIKILQPEFASEREFLMRFEREARAAASLRSPHVVRVFDVDASPEGLSYIVMELLEGRDLADEALETKIPLPQLIDWIVQTCAGLQEAHDNGIVHRDLKPANVFLTKIESGDRIAKVLDFGISKVEATSTSLLTGRAAGALGTPTYMAPEQIRNRTVDGRADLWALGVMLYRLLGSRWPFNGKGDQAYMTAVIADPALPFEMVRPDLPYELATVIMKALEKDLASRHQSANELAVALAPFGTGRGPIAIGSSLTGASRSSGPMAAAGSVAPPAGPMAIIMLAQGGAQSGRAAVMDTVADAPREERRPPVVTDYVPPYAVASPPATAFEPTPTRASRRVGAGMIIGACVAAAVGFGAYMVVTARTPSSAAAGTPPASSSSDVPQDMPPPALDLPPAAEARAAATGVPPEPSASAPPRRRGPRPLASASTPAASAVTPARPPANEGVPDHL
jgi:serine/threonine-protein kinase